MKIILNNKNYAHNISRNGPDNIWILSGSHKFWKHKYNQSYTVNLQTQNELKTQVRIYIRTTTTVIVIHHHHQHQHQ